MKLAGWFALGAGCGLLWLPSKTSLEVAKERSRKEGLEVPFVVPKPNGEENEKLSRVSFYGQLLEGDGIVFVVDAGRAMVSSGGLERTKGEILRSVMDLSPKTQFALVFFGTRISRFPSSGQPAEASVPAKSSAVAWVRAVAEGCGTSIFEGFREALEFANRTSARRKVVVYVGHGGLRSTFAGGAKELVGAITSLNAQRVRIDCIDLLGGDSGAFLEELAAANGGSYRRSLEGAGRAEGQSAEEKQANGVVE